MARYKEHRQIVFAQDASLEEVIYQEQPQTFVDEITDDFSIGQSFLVPLLHGETKSIDLTGFAKVQLILIKSDKAVDVLLGGGTIPIAPRVSTTASAPALPARFSAWVEMDTSPTLSIHNGGVAAADDAKVLVVIGGS